MCDATNLCPVSRDGSLPVGGANMVSTLILTAPALGENKMAHQHGHPQRPSSRKNQLPISNFRLLHRGVDVVDHTEKFYITVL